MIHPGDIQLLMPPRRTLGLDRQTGQTIAVYELLFSIRGKGSYVATVPIEGYSAALARAALELVAKPIVETLDEFGG